MASPRRSASRKALPNPLSEAATPGSTATGAGDGAPGGFKPKKSVALSGVPAGNTALCTVGRTGNDLH